VPGSRPSSSQPSFSKDKPAVGYQAAKQTNDVFGQRRSLSSSRVGVPLKQSEPIVVLLVKQKGWEFLPVTLLKSDESVQPLGNILLVKAFQKSLRTATYECPGPRLFAAIFVQGFGQRVKPMTFDDLTPTTF
jgi:hypothetical protein